MISSLKQPAVPFGLGDFVRSTSPAPRSRLAILPSISAAKNPGFSLSLRKPLHLASLEGFGFGSRDAFLSAAKPRGLGFKCEAYEADRSESVEISQGEARSAAAQKVKIGIYFATWWALNVVFNIYNKKVFHYRPLPSWSSRVRRLFSSSAFSIVCLLVGISGFLFGSVSVSRPMIARRKCADFKPISISVTWDRGEGSKLVAEERGGDGSGKRHKVMGFVGIQTGFGSVGRRRSLRKTWFPSDRQSLLRLEESTGLAFRFVIGKTNDKLKMEILRRETEEYDDFMLLDTVEEYIKLPYKT